MPSFAGRWLISALILRARTGAAPSLVPNGRGDRTGNQCWRYESAGFQIVDDIDKSPQYDRFRETLVIFGRLIIAA